MNKKPLIILTGPTSVGKTALSIKLARAVDGEIISADSMQVYKYMDIGTAKITRDEMDGVPHYLIDEFEPHEDFNVFIFKQYAKRYIEQIHQRNKTPILTGGTGFYIQAVLYDIDFDESETDIEFRNELEQIASIKGSQYIHFLLKTVDPESAEAIHPHNIKRVIRALEYIRLTGKPISAHNREQRQKESPYAYKYFVLNTDREKLYENINKRVDIMIEKGLVEEVKRLMDMGYTKDMVSMQGLGYKEIIEYLEGNRTLDEAIEIIKRDTRHYAKRQITWFKREKDVIWIDKDSYSNDEEIINYMLKEIRQIL